MKRRPQNRNGAPRKIAKTQPNRTQPNRTQPTTLRVWGALSYARLRLGNGCVIHLLGEFHHTPAGADSGSTGIIDLVDSIMNRGAARGVQTDLYLERRAGQLLGQPTRSELSSGTLQKLLNKHREHFPLFPHGRVVKTLPHARVHMGDIRDARLDPFQMTLFNHLYKRSFGNRPNENVVGRAANALLNAPSVPRAPLDKNTANELEAVLRSNTYTGQHFDNYHSTARFYGHTNNAHDYKKFRRDVTTFEGAAVSRLRKQLLKLDHGLGDAMLAIFDRWFLKGYHHSYILLTDMYQIARMLYYAGYGKQRPATPSRVIVSVVGSTHVANMWHLFKALDKVSRGALGLRPECFVHTTSEAKPLTIPRFEFGF